MVQRYKYVCDDCLNDDFTGKLPSRKVILRKIEKLQANKNRDHRHLEKLVRDVYVSVGFPECSVQVLKNETITKISVNLGAYKKLKSVQVLGLPEGEQENFKNLTAKFFAEKSVENLINRVNPHALNRLLFGGKKIEYFIDKPFRNREILRFQTYVLELLKSKGFIHARVLGSYLSERKIGGSAHIVEVSLVIKVLKGKKSLIKRIEIEHEAYLPKNLVASIYGQIDKPANPRKTSFWVKEIENYLSGQGYMHVMADAELREMMANNGILMKFNIKLGKKVFFDELEVLGTEISRSEIIRAELGLTQGEPISYKQLGVERAHLLALDIFEKVEFKLLNNNKLLLQVVEKPRVRFEVGVGVSLDQGPRAALKFRFRNILGVGIHLNSHVQLNYPALFYSVPFVYTAAASENLLHRFDDFSSDIRALLFFEGKAITSLNYPKIYFLNKNLGIFLDAILRREIRVSFTLNQLALELRSVSKIGEIIEFGPKIEAAYSFFACGIEPDNLTGQCGNMSLKNNFRQDSGTIKEINSGMFFKLYMREKWRAGFDALLGFGQAELSLGSKEIGYLKFNMSLKILSQLAPKIEHIMNIRLGAIGVLKHAGYVPMFRRFYLGGGKSLRGFPQDQILPADDKNWSAREYLPSKNLIFQPLSQGGNFLMVFQNEFRFPLSNKLLGAVFLDSGQLLENILNFSPLNFALGTGVGLRYETLFGELQVDLAIRLMDGNRQIFSDFGEAFGLYFAINPN